MKKIGDTQKQKVLVDDKEVEITVRVKGVVEEQAEESKPAESEE